MDISPNSMHICPVNTWETLNITRFKRNDKINKNEMSLIVSSVVIVLEIENKW